jgi:hypothetical protein
VGQVAAIHREVEHVETSKFQHAVNNGLSGAKRDLVTRRDSSTPQPEIGKDIAHS